MRFRSKNYKENNPEIFNKLIKNNPYMAQIYNFPDILYPHPSIEKLEKNKKHKYRLSKNKSASSKIHLEIGCGSGRYLIKWATEKKQDLFIGFEIRYKRLVLAAKKIERQQIKNIILMREQGEFFEEYFQHNKLDFLHINFPDPWSKKSQKKKRLLNYNFLKKLFPILSFNGEIRFKTDHQEYFETVAKIIAEMKNFSITDFTKDLHNSIFSKKRAYQLLG